MDKSHLNSLIVVHLFEVNKDSFHPKKENKKLFGPKIHISMQLMH